MTAPDLVSELREAFRVEPGETLHAQHPKYLGNLAADAIERLTRERDALLVESDGRKELLGRYKAERDAARAELAALREQTRIRVTATEPPRVEHYKVLALKASWDVWTMQEGGVVVARPEKYPRWLPLPATPEQEPPTGEWIPLSPESAPPEGVRVRVLTIKGCEYYATRSGQAMLIGVPDSWGTVCTHWKCDPDSAPEAEPGKDDREGGA